MNPPPCSSGKRPFGSPGAARMANITNPKRIRVYLCDECKSYHTTSKKKEKYR